MLLCFTVFQATKLRCTKPASVLKLAFPDATQPGVIAACCFELHTRQHVAMGGWMLQQQEARTVYWYAQSMLLSYSAFHF